MLSLALGACILLCSVLCVLNSIILKISNSITISINACASPPVPRMSDSPDSSPRKAAKPAVHLRSRRQSFEEDAVTSIQAIIRGKLTRKQSLHGRDIDERLSPDPVGSEDYTDIGPGSGTGTGTGSAGSANGKSNANANAAAPLATTTSSTAAAAAAPSPVRYQRKYDSRGMPLNPLRGSSPGAGVTTNSNSVNSR